MAADTQWDARNRAFVSPSDLRQYQTSPPRPPLNQFDQAQMDSMDLGPQAHPPPGHSPLNPQRADVTPGGNRMSGANGPARMQGAPMGLPLLHGMDLQPRSPPASPPQTHGRTQSAAGGGGGWFSNFRKGSTLSVQRQNSQSDARADEFGTGPRAQQAQTMPARPTSMLVQSSSQQAQQGHVQQPAQQQPQQPQPARRMSTQQQAPAPLHAEIKSVVNLSLAHAYKVYFSGPLVRHVERQADGHRVAKDEGWTDVWGQLGGTTLSVWDMKEIEEASKEGRQVPPAYINITDAFVQVLGSVTIPATPEQPARKFTNVLTLNTAGSNLILFACPSTQALISWASALRLSAWEKSRLEEIYTAHLIRTTLAVGGKTHLSGVSPAINLTGTLLGVEPRTSLARGRMEGWVKVRLSGQTDWKRLWMVLTAANAAPGHISNSSHELAQVDSRSSAPSVPKKNRRSGLFGRNRDTSPPPPTGATPGQALIVLYNGPKGKDRKKPVLSVRDVTQVFAVYPERPELISKSSLIKLEGLMGDEEVIGGMKGREAFVLLMPEVEPGKDGPAEMLKWVVAFHDAFQLYGRPKSYSWDPRNPLSMMFAYPIGPHKDLLFLDRELAETLDPRDDRTSVVRARLLNILLDRMRTGGAPPNTPPSPDAADTGTHNAGPPMLPPIGGIGFGSQQQQQQPQQSLAYKNDLSLPQLPPLGFDNERTSPPPAVTHSGRRRDLSPIRERSGTESMLTDTRQNGGTGSQDRIGTPSVHSNTLASRQHSLATQHELGDQSQQQSPSQASSFLGSRLVTRSPSPSPQDADLAYAQSQRSRDQAPFLPGSRPDSKLSYHSGPQRSFTSSSQDAPRSVDPTNVQLPPSHMNSPEASQYQHGSMFSPPLSQRTPPRSPQLSSPQVETPNSVTSPTSKRLSSFSYMTSPYSIAEGEGPSPVGILDSLIPPPPPLPLSKLPAPPSSLVPAVQSTPPPLTPASVLPAVPVVEPEAPAASESAKLDDYFYNEPGALYYVQQQNALSQPTSGPVQAMASNDDDTASSERGPSPPIREAAARPGSRSPPQPPQPVRRGTPDALSTLSGTADSAATASRFSNLGRKPSGARAPPVTRPKNQFEGSQASLAEHEHENDACMQPVAPTTPLPASDTQNTMDSAMDAQADALAALTFLEQEDRTPVVAQPPPSSSSSSPPPPPSRPQIVEPEHRAPSPSEDAPTQSYRSSFVPSRQAAERKARMEAQQAAHQAAAHQPGRANGKKKIQDRGAWNDSSEEEEEEEEEDDDDDDVDSDGAPRPANREMKQSGMAAPIPQAPIRPLQPQYRDLSPSASAASMPAASPRGPRHLPQHPGSAYSPAGSDDAHAHFDRNSQYARRTFVDEGGPMRQPSPHGQPHYPHPGAPRRDVWSNVLEPGKAVEPSHSGRDTFVQLEEHSETMTKAFTPQGLLSAGLQDKQDRSAKRQEELARESGASLINVPNKPPPPQVGLLGAITAHERERKREGGVGAALTEREREKRVAEERQRKLDDLQRQQLEQQQQMMQPGSTMSMYGGQQGQFNGYNPMMMMGMNPMMMGMMGYPGMMNPQQMFAAQQAAQAYQQAMMTFSQAGSHYDGNAGNQGRNSPQPGMGGMGSAMSNFGAFDPRMSMMMGSPMGQPMGSPMGSPMGQPMGNPMGSPMGTPGPPGSNMNNMGMGMGMMPGMGMGMPMQMTGNSGFDPRFSMGPSQFDGNIGAAGPQIHSYSSSPAQPEGSSLEDPASEEAKVYEGEVPPSAAHPASPKV